MRTCTIPNCDGEIHARGWCLAHYNRWKRAGKPAVFDGGGDMPLPQSQEAKQGRAFLLAVNTKARIARSRWLRERERQARERLAAEVWARDLPLGAAKVHSGTRDTIRSEVLHALHRLSWTARYW